MVRKGERGRWGGEKEFARTAKLDFPTPLLKFPIELSHRFLFQLVDSAGC